MDRRWSLGFDWFGLLGAEDWRWLGWLGSVWPGMVWIWSGGGGRPTGGWEDGRMGGWEDGTAEELTMMGEN